MYLLLKKIATTLLTGIILTTERFQIQTSAQTLITAGYLLSQGAQMSHITHHTHHARTATHIYALGTLLERFRQYKESSLVWSYLAEDESVPQNPTLLMYDIRSMTPQYHIAVIGIQKGRHLLCVCATNQTTASLIAHYFKIHTNPIGCVVALRSTATLTAFVKTVSHIVQESPYQPQTTP